MAADDYAAAAVAAGLRCPCGSGDIVERRPGSRECAECERLAHDDGAGVWRWLSAAARRRAAAAFAAVPHDVERGGPGDY
jgi:hypothetical protein